MFYGNLYKYARFYYLFSIASLKSDLIAKYPQFEKDIQFLTDNDSSGNNKYLNYAVKVLISGKALTNEINDVIQLFHKYQNKLNQKDINQWNFTNLRDELFSI